MKNSKAMVSYYFFRPISSIFATSRVIFTICENFVIFYIIVVQKSEKKEGSGYFVKEL